MREFYKQITDFITDSTVTRPIETNQTTMSHQNDTPTDVTSTTATPGSSQNDNDDNDTNVLLQDLDPTCFDSIYDFWENMLNHLMVSTPQDAICLLKKCRPRLQEQITSLQVIYKEKDEDDEEEDEVELVIIEEGDEGEEEEDTFDLTGAAPPPGPPPPTPSKRKFKQEGDEETDKEAVVVKKKK